eukprot:m51a1_g3148 putative pelle il-1 receptor associated kinase (429) ;mRNA; r:320719-322237
MSRRNARGPVYTLGRSGAGQFASTAPSSSLSVPSFCGNTWSSKIAAAQHRARQTKFPPVPARGDRRRAAAAAGDASLLLLPAMASTASCATAASSVAPDDQVVLLQLQQIQQEELAAQGPPLGAREASFVRMGTLPAAVPPRQVSFVQRPDGPGQQQQGEGQQAGEGALVLPQVPGVEPSSLLGAEGSGGPSRGMTAPAAASASAVMQRKDDEDPSSLPSLSRSRRGLKMQTSQRAIRRQQVAAFLEQSEVTVGNVRDAFAALKKVATRSLIYRESMTSDWDDWTTGDEPVAAISEKLDCNTTLTKLDLEGCRVGPPGATSLAGVLRKNTALKQLNLGYNNIESEGAIAIALALEGNTSLTFLNVFSNDFEEDAAKAIADALKRNRGLKHLVVACNTVCDGGAMKFAEALESNTTLTAINLESAMLSI